MQCHELMYLSIFTVLIIKASLAVNLMVSSKMKTEALQCFSGNCIFVFSLWSVHTMQLEVAQLVATGTVKCFITPSARRPKLWLKGFALRN